MNGRLVIRAAVAVAGGLLRDGWTVTALRRRVAARKSPEHNQSEERLSGRISIELANLLCIDLGISVNEKGSLLRAASPAPLVAAARGGAYTFGSGKGSRTGSGLSLLRMPRKGANARRQRVTVALNDVVKLFGESGGFLV
jgi:hypothetical protein